MGKIRFHSPSGVFQSPSFNSASCFLQAVPSFASFASSCLRDRFPVRLRHVNRVRGTESWLVMVGLRSLSLAGPTLPLVLAEKLAETLSAVLCHKNRQEPHWHASGTDEARQRLGEPAGWAMPQESPPLAAEAIPAPPSGSPKLEDEACRYPT